MPTKTKVNKTQVVTDALAKDPDASPKELAAKLTKRGIKMSAGYVSTIKSSLKKKGGVKGAKRRSRQSDDSVSLAALVEAKGMVERLGGIETARAVLNALSKLE